ncbi:hypothetical protein ACGFYA_13560, partial [Streptomyces sp. NPDC048305]|uniref:hypothetical protein n=1 Tax=Streptomyces sp. NPDC048305 TaxID=3365532 RepID=UPI0037145CF6
FQLYQTLFRSVSGPNLIPAACGVAFAFRLIRLYQAFSVALTEVSRTCEVPVRSTVWVEGVAANPRG